MRFHEIGDIERRGLYRAAYSILVPGGTVVIVDEVRGASEGLESLYQEAWREDAQRHGIPGADTSRVSEFGGGATGMMLGNELTWLSHVGFRDVDIYYKNFRFAVFGGRRPVSSELSFGETHGGATGQFGGG